MSSSSDEESNVEEFRDDMRVFLRLRPMNKLEQSRRSKNCIELHEDTTVITVDSPLEGEYDFVFDHVFEEYASQEEVYEQALADVPHNLVEGYNSTVVAYGQTGTGKTHTMLGVNGGSEALLYKMKRESFRSSMRSSTATGGGGGGGSSRQLAATPDASVAETGGSESEGMIPRVISGMFELIRDAPSTVEFTIRCSYVEIYLEKIMDLLHPQGGTGVTLTLVDEEADRAAGVSSNVRIRGASELCCFDESDVCALLARGNACRTMSSTEMNTDSSRSHAIFVLRIEQRDTTTGRIKQSILHMVDLAGSELGQRQPQASKRASMRVAGGEVIQVEAAMINKSLNSLNRMIRAQLERQAPVESVARISKLTRLLRPSFGGNCMTTLILTASPSSYNISETINTIKFGQRCRKVTNHPHIVETESTATYRKKLMETDKKHRDAMELIQALAAECLALRDGKSNNNKNNKRLWDTIEDLATEYQDPDIHFSVTARRGDEKATAVTLGGSGDMALAERAQDLEEKLESTSRELLLVSQARDEAENHLSEIQSEVAVLRTQNLNLNADKKKNVQELVDAKNEIQALSLRKLEVEHNLRTSQFRENEAIVFLRQFRRFYRNVLKDKAAHGSGSIQAIALEVTEKVANAPDLQELRDVDTLLYESGLIEDFEVGEDRSSASYKPTKESLLRSAAGAQKASAAESELPKNSQSSSSSSSSSEDDSEASGSSAEEPFVEEQQQQQQQQSDEEDNEGAGADAGAGSSKPEAVVTTATEKSHAHSIFRPRNTGISVTNKQKLLKTPSGRLTAMREKDLEQELLEMSERCIELQMALNEEKAVVDSISNKPGGLSKKKLAQDAISLRQQLEKKTASLTAIAWKMNELNLINKTNNEKMVNREQHVLYLEEQLVELQNSNRRLVMEVQENEKKMTEEIDNLREVVDGMTVPLWQFGESKVSQKPLASRIMVSVQGGEHPEEEESVKRRVSDGASEPASDSEYDSSEEDDESTDESRSRSPAFDDSESLGDVSYEAETPEPTRRAMAIPPAVADASIQTDPEPSVRKYNVSVQTDPEPSVRKFNISVQTDPEPVTKKFNASSQTNPEPEKFDASMQTNPEPDKFDASVQTDAEPDKFDASIQTDAEPEKFDASMQTDAEPEKFDASMQTDAVEKHSIGLQTRVETEEAGVQAGVQVRDMDMQTDEEPKEEPKATTETCTQTEPQEEETAVVVLPEKHETATQTDAVRVLHFAESDSVHVQTDGLETDEAAIQTEPLPTRDVGTTTEKPVMVETGIDAMPVVMVDKQVSTDPIEMVDKGVLTDPMEEKPVAIADSAAGSAAAAVGRSVEREEPEKPQKAATGLGALFGVFMPTAEKKPEQEPEPPTKEDPTQQEEEEEETSEEEETVEDNIQPVENTTAWDKHDYLEDNASVADDFMFDNATESDNVGKQSEEVSNQTSDKQSEDSQTSDNVDKQNEDAQTSEVADKQSEDTQTSEVADKQSEEVSNQTSDNVAGKQSEDAQTSEVADKQSDNVGKQSESGSRPTVLSRFMLDRGNAKADSGHDDRSRTSAASRFMLDDESKSDHSRLGSNSRTSSVSRFMLDDDSKSEPGKRLGTDRSKAPVTSRFMLDEGRDRKSPSKSAPRRVLLDSKEHNSHASTSRYQQNREKIVADTVSFDDTDYDNLGKKWGMSESDIAADTAILNNPAKMEKILADHPEEEEDEDALQASNSKDSTGDNSSAAGAMPNAFVLYSDEEEDGGDDDDAPEAFSVNSMNDDDFDRMMDETAAALAAAEELLPTDDEEEETKKSLADNADMDSYEKSDHEANRSTYVVDDTSTVVSHQESVDNRVQLNSDMLHGGKPFGFEPRRFVKKLGPLIKPAAKDIGKQRPFPEPDDVSVTASVSSKREREVAKASKKTTSRSRSTSHRNLGDGEEKQKKKKKKKQDGQDDSAAAGERKKKKKKKEEKKSRRSRSRLRE